jgi:hypothetical protein
MQQPRIKLTAAQAQSLKEATLAGVALNQSIQVHEQLVQKAINNAQAEIQRKVQEHHGNLQQIWQGIAKAYAIDVKNIAWDYDESTGEIFARAIQFPGANSASG